MTKPFHLRLRDLLTNLIDQFKEINKIILFGSRARGDHEERSDIDLAIDAEVSEYTWDQICSYIEEEAETLLPFDFIWLQHTSEALRKRINQEGIVLYERKSRPKSP